MAEELAERITADPDVMVGKPVVKGTRIPVYVVLEFLAANPSFDDLFADYPDLTMADVQACLAYAGALARQVNGARPVGEIPPELLEQIAPDLRAAAQDVWARYAPAIRYLGQH
jgi:uncharacterized protein (DUF433 family)